MFATAKVAGVNTPTTNTAVLVMPPLNAPALTSAGDTGPTSGCATAAPPVGVSYDSCTFVFTPVSRLGGFGSLA